MTKFKVLSLVSIRNLLMFHFFILGYGDIVESLIEHGASVNVKTKDKETALHRATWQGNYFN